MTGARIHYSWDRQLYYYYPPQDYIKFPHKELFLQGPGRLVGYVDSMIHQVGHWTEVRLGWSGSPAIRELRVEMVAGFIMTPLGLPNLKLLQHHREQLPGWRAELTKTPGLGRRCSPESLLVSFRMRGEKRVDQSPPHRVIVGRDPK